ncbi:RING finger protein 24-like [Lampris incognitus]|uniref:RING finger protein 24-like n=1 Tax=Lampris incognitus TaxID=2546036 RepID=UPI0024B56D01|nr:RING finger protein 24-like [Lampris incognitus]
MAFITKSSGKAALVGLMGPHKVLTHQADGRLSANVGLMADRPATVLSLFDGWESWRRIGWKNLVCCILLRRQGTREHYGYNQVVLKGPGKKLSLLGQTCPVCLEEFRTKDELGVCPCSHAFHKKCLLKWLEIRSVCPMCNNPICRLQPNRQQGAEGPQSTLEV